MRASICLFLGLATACAGSQRIVFEDVLEYSSPTRLRRVSGRPIDSVVGQWRGRDVRISIDYGMHADSLQRRPAREQLEAFEESIDGRACRGLSYLKLDGSHYTAVHCPDPGLTFSVFTQGRRSRRGRARDHPQHSLQRRRAEPLRPRPTR